MPIFKQRERKNEKIRKMKKKLRKKNNYFLLFE